MKIAVNLLLASPRSATGAFVYIQDILPALCKAERNNTYYLIGRSETIRYFKSRYRDLPAISFRIFDIRRDVFVNPLRAARKLMAKIRGDSIAHENIVAEEVRAFIKKEAIDVYFSPFQTLFPADPSPARAVTTILDLQFEYFPENFPANYLAERKRGTQYAVDHSDRLLAISSYTKKTLGERYGVAPEKVTVTYCAPHEMTDAPAHIAIPQDFVFYPAALWPHKNHRILIRALGILKDRFPSLQAVCSGMTKGGGFKSELESLAKSEGLEGRVSFMGYVPDNQLRLLYLHAKALVFPSSFEGFGMPLVEAFHLGVPVIAADNSSITEVVDGAGLLVPTDDADALAAAIEKVLTNDRLRNELIQKGRERAKLFSWEKAARETIAVFKNAARDAY